MNRQERLRRLNAQIKKLDAEQAPAVPQTPVMQGPPKGKHTPGGGYASAGAVATPGSVGGGGGSHKRKADDMSGGGASKKKKSGKNEFALVPHGKMKLIFQHAENLMNILLKDKAAQAYFNAPVDVVALGIPHYTQIIEVSFPPFSAVQLCAIWCHLPRAWVSDS